MKEMIKHCGSMMKELDEEVKEEAITKEEVVEEDKCSIRPLWIASSVTNYDIFNMNVQP